MIPKSRGGPTSVVIYDIHALQERFYFGDDVLPCFETGIPLLLQRLSQLPDADNVRSSIPSFVLTSIMLPILVVAAALTPLCPVGRSPLPSQMMGRGSASTSHWSTSQWSACSVLGFV
jgi:hypothetical protein